SALALTAGTAIAQETPSADAHAGHTPPAESTQATPSTDTPDAKPATEATAPATTEAPASTAAPAEGTIAAAVASNADLSTLSSALTAADLTATLGQPGPFTVFAPTNEAFNLIPADTRTALMNPANKE